MGLRYWFAGGALIGCLALVALAVEGAWVKEQWPLGGSPFGCCSSWSVEVTVEPPEGWAQLVLALGATAWFGWIAASEWAVGSIPPRTRAADVCGALAVSGVFALSGMLVGFAALGYDLRPTLAGMLQVGHLTASFPFAQVFGAFAWGVFLVDLAWRLHVPPTERGVAGDRVAAALAGALLVIVGVCGVRPPYFMH